MFSIDHPNVVQLIRVARALGPLLEEVVFVGGATVALFVTRAGLVPIRSTKDVDMVVSVSSRVRYHAFAEVLRQKGFKEDSEANILCRWLIDDIVVDVMPTDTTILGFSNQWYPLAWDTAEHCELNPDCRIRLISAPCFLATKVDAFLGRGRGDYLLSHDLDDIVSVVLGRPEVVGEVENGPAEVRAYLVSSFKDWLEDRDFLDSLAGHLAPDAVSQAHSATVLERLREIVALGA